MKRTILKRRSDKGKKADRKYLKEIKAFKEGHPYCEACAVLGPHKSIHEFGVLSIRRATEIHHKAGREGALLLDQRYWLPVCRSCHDWIGAHGKLAVMLGLRVILINETGLKTR